MRLTRARIWAIILTRSVTLIAEGRSGSKGRAAQAGPVKSLGAHPDQLFASFERTPVASASIAQVHFATTIEGGTDRGCLLTRDVHELDETGLDPRYLQIELTERSALTDLEATSAKLRRLRMHRRQGHHRQPPSHCRVTHIGLTQTTCPLRWI